MADNDSSMIKPVDPLLNITGVIPTRRREQRRRRQNLGEQNKEKSQEEITELVDEETNDSKLAENENGQSTIDYCA